MEWAGRARVGQDRRGRVVCRVETARVDRAGQGQVSARNKGREKGRRRHRDRVGSRTRVLLRINFW